MTVILWFKRDLRLADHPALTLAAGLGPVLPVYILEPGLWAQPDASGRQWDFVADSLTDLRKEVARMGGRLVVRQGDAVETLAGLARRHRATTLVSHQETGNLWTYARDRRVAAWARDAGLPWHQPPQQGVIRRLSGRDDWAAARDRYVGAPVLPVPPVHWVRDADPGSIAAIVPRLTDNCPGRQPGGRARGLQTLHSFLDRRGETYRTALSSPLTATDACSRLSPHLAWGTLSIREVDQSRAAHVPPSRQWAGSLTSFAGRLAWRDHFTQKLEDQPDIETRCLDPLTATLRPTTPDANRLGAWTRGETGLPFVDACMRCLQATGWINFRMRAMLMAVASYHLWLDWRATGPVLARAFTDYDPGIHWPQVQMQSGTTGINTIRIYNPVKQGRDQDPDGRFTRAWLPELAAVPLPHLQTPWTWDGARSLRYPPPIIDPASAQRAARDAVWAVRRDPAAPAIAAAIVTKHASRKDAFRRYVRDPIPAPPRQLTLDL
jgi:deoxyribodipyrimidine photo-lyase